MNFWIFLSQLLAIYAHVVRPKAKIIPLRYCSHFKSCGIFCHSSDKGLYFIDNSGNEHDSTKLVQGTPSEISRRNFWYNKNFFWVKFLGSNSGGSRSETKILPVTGNHF